jgi:CRISPR/Cas system CSM-associated protein Csm3 (group 7 of RAMP superfamily)
MTLPNQSHPQSDAAQWKFKMRWRIEGTLTTKSPLHIGSGEIITHKEKGSKENTEFDVAAVISDHGKCACIPGAALKGSLRSWLSKNVVENHHIEDLFGKEAATQDLGSGGKAEFHDALMKTKLSHDPPLSYWDHDHQTYVEVMNAVNRETGTAADKHLIHSECVPAGVGFGVVITGVMNEDDVAFLLGAMAGFNREKKPVRLGADTASGKGSLVWKPGRVSCMDREHVKEWITNPNRTRYENHMKDCRISPARLELKEHGLRYFDIGLRFQGPFLVSDPVKKSEPADKEDNTLPDFRPRCDEKGHIILPAKSFRGAFRSQAEKILRTMMGIKDLTDKETWEFVHRYIACRPEVKGLGCKPLQDGEKPEEKLCLACQLFGASGWRTPLVISDFKWGPGSGDLVPQEFIAIDRFTGGGAKSLKYKAKCRQSPHFHGMLGLDMSRFKNDWPMGLLVLTLRDLLEGDIRFGYGASKGYGYCVADIVPWENPDFQKEVLEGGLDNLRDIIEKKKNQLRMQPKGEAV